MALALPPKAQAIVDRAKSRAKSMREESQKYTAMGMQAGIAGVGGYFYGQKDETERIKQLAANKPIVGYQIAGMPASLALALGGFGLAVSGMVPKGQEEIAIAAGLCGITLAAEERGRQAARDAAAKGKAAA